MTKDYGFERDKLVVELLDKIAFRLGVLQFTVTLLGGAIVGALYG